MISWTESGFDSKSKQYMCRIWSKMLYSWLFIGTFALLDANTVWPVLKCPRKPGKIEFAEPKQSYHIVSLLFVYPAVVLSQKVRVSMTWELLVPHEKQFRLLHSKQLQIDIIVFGAAANSDSLYSCCLAFSMSTNRVYIGVVCEILRLTHCAFVFGWLCIQRKYAKSYKRNNSCLFKWLYIILFGAKFIPTSCGINVM